MWKGDEIQNFKHWLQCIWGMNLVRSNWDFNLKALKWPLRPWNVFLEHQKVMILSLYFVGYLCDLTGSPTVTLIIVGIIQVLGGISLCCIPLLQTHQRRRREFSKNKITEKKESPVYKLKESSDLPFTQLNIFRQFTQSWTAWTNFKTNKYKGTKRPCAKNVTVVA